MVAPDLNPNPSLSDPISWFNFPVMADLIGYGELGTAGCSDEHDDHFEFRVLKNTHWFSVN